MANSYAVMSEFTDWLKKIHPKTELYGWQRDIANVVFRMMPGGRRRGSMIFILSMLATYLRTSDLDRGRNESETQSS